MYSAKIEKDNCCTLLKGIPILSISIGSLTQRERERAYGPVYITVLHGLPLESMENKLVWLQKRKEKENIIYAIGWWKLINVSLLCT